MKTGTAEVLNDLLSRYPALEKCEASILDAYTLLIGAVQNKGLILVCGNGGNASDAEHIVGELMKSFVLERPIPSEEKTLLRQYGEIGADLADHLQGTIPSVALVSGIPLSTAISNDIGSEYVFAQKVYGLADENSVLVALSTSGNSVNCMYAAVTAKLKGCPVLVLTGEREGKLANMGDVVIKAPAKLTHEIQEYYLPIYHALCAMLETEVFGA